MRIYKSDGTYVENQRDTDFGWNFVEITEEETDPPEKEINKNIRSHPLLGQLKEEEEFRDSFLESICIPEPKKPVMVKHVEVNVKTEPIANVICTMEVEGPPIKNDKPTPEKEDNNISYPAPSKEELAKLINPCNIETKSLMSIICFAKYKALIKEETSAELFKAVNFKTTNSKRIMREKQNSIQEEMRRDIEHYQAHKEDSMLSLMMELILADLGCNLEDIVDIDGQITERDNRKNPFETSDLGNSIQSSFCSRDLSSFRSSNWSTPERSSVLSSIGLENEDKSLQSFCDETLEMRLQTAEIKECFLEEENRVNQLIKMTTALKEEVRETLYLDDILYLLKGDLDKVKLKKLPFKIFYEKPDEELELNLIV